jgi:hypothetical protein
LVYRGAPCGDYLSTGLLMFQSDWPRAVERHGRPGDVLVPIKHLENGSTIAQMTVAADLFLCRAGVS